MAAFVLIYRQYLLYSDLANHGMTTFASVSDVQKHSRGGPYAKYTYTVNGVDYEGESDVDLPYDYTGPLKITYSPTSPGFADANPRSEVKSTISGMVTSCVWVVFVIVMAVLGKKSPKAKNKIEQPTK